MKLRTALLTLITVFATSLSQAESKFNYRTYLEPVKVNNKDQYDYNYMILLTYQEAYSFLFKEKHTSTYSDNLNNLRIRCDDIGAMQTKKDFIQLNKQFATVQELNFELTDKLIASHKKNVGDNCKAIYDLSKKEAQKELRKMGYK